MSYILSTLFALGVCSGAMGQSQTNNTIQAENPIIQQASIDIRNQIEVYPNPAVEFVIIEIQNSDLVDTQFEMHSLIGNEVTIEPEEIGYNLYRIPVKHFSTGYYFLVVKDEISRYKKAFKFLKK
ncbi:MAG: T9SS type A sorting domain-containing protein [Bacteroidota bacterium]